jgi:uncharacterized protein YndB with AHSA1/START domain
MTWLATYADACYCTAQRRQIESAGRFGIDVIRAWSRDTLESTAFYQEHREVLDQRRGSGYWLWKPFIIRETLKEMDDGELLVYSDAGIAIVASLGPVLALCRDGRDVVLFANHYRDIGENDCATWTKRDCFVLMDCDEPRFHDGPMVDASFLIVRKSERSTAFIDDWLSYACRSELLTDTPTAGPLPDFPRFIQHRHDQSILALLAIRYGIELFRHPSQHGNHLKPAHLREPGEWTRFPYSSSDVFHNSPYTTLLNHHRGALGQTGLRVTLRQVIRASQAQAFEAWTREDILASWSPPDFAVVAVSADVRIGGRYGIDLQRTPPGGGRPSGPRLTLGGEYTDVRPSSHLAYTSLGGSRISVDFAEVEEGVMVTLEHGDFRTEARREFFWEIWESFLEHLASRVSVPERSTAVHV